MIKVIVSKSVIGTCCVVDNDDGEMVMIDEITPIIRPIETKKRCSYKITLFIFDLLKPIDFLLILFLMILSIPSKAPPQTNKIFLVST